MTHFLENIIADTKRVIGSTALFGTIHESDCTISVNFYIYLQYFQQKVSNFRKLSGS